MAPLKGASVFPAGWSEYHRPVAQSSMTAMCDIFLPGERTGLDEAPGQVAYSDVICRVQERNSGGSGDQVTAGREVQTREYLITVPHTIDAQTGSNGHRVRITKSGDPHMVDRIFTITQVMYGSEIWERDLICVDDMGVAHG